MKLLKAALIGAALLTVGQAWAQKGVDRSATSIDTPLYIGAHYGKSTWREGCLTQPCDNTGNVGRALAGWQFTEILAAEISYNNVGKITAQNYFVKSNIWEVAALAAWPLTDSFSLYGKVGGYRAASESNAPSKVTNSKYLYGGGAAFDFTRNITVRAELQRYAGVGGPPTMARSDIDVLSAGILWRFR
jgi:opacity protein-like surface antigen